MSEWITVKEAANILKCSDRHVRNMAATGKLRARKEGNVWLIHSSFSKPSSFRRVTEEQMESEKEAVSVPTESISESERITGLLEEIRWLKERIENQEKELSELRRELAESSTRHDTIIMQMTRQLELPKSSFFKRLFGRSKDKHTNNANY